MRMEKELNKLIELLDDLEFYIYIYGFKKENKEI